MNNIAIQIEYNAFQNNFELEDFKDVNLFKEELSEDYIANIKGIPVGRGGGAYELIVKLILDIDLQTFLGVIAGGLAYDLVKMGTKKYFLKPLLEAYKRFKERNDDSLIICELRFLFQDTVVIVKSLENLDLYPALPKVFDKLTEKYKYLVTLNNEKPAEISIPVIFDKDLKNKKYREPFTQEEDFDGNYKLEDYYKYWGTRYVFSYKQIVFDVMNEKYLDEEYYTEEEFWREYYS
jgi:hypothetical protein